MKALSYLVVVLIGLSFSAPSSAVYFDVIGPCSSTPAYKGIFKTDLTENVGKVSMDIFDFHKISYIGTEDGMNSIIGTPTGTDAIEVISDTKMRAYGWCYSVNGEIPDVLPSSYFFTKQTDYVSWFYAFSTYDQGVWLDYCVPAHTIKAQQFCK